MSKQETECCASCRHVSLKDFCTGVCDHKKSKKTTVNPSDACSLWEERERRGAVKMSEPIIEFKTDKEARECLKEWQNRLYLSDWIISLSLVDTEELLVNGKPMAGTNNLDFVHKACVISVARRTESMNDRIVKTPHELVLVHELLHCKYNWIGGEGYEKTYVDETEHALLEQMARSLMMAKYNLTPDWFNNVKDD